MAEYWNSLSTLNKFKFILSLLMGIIAVVFATLNWESQEVHLIVKKIHMPLSLLIIFSILSGYGISFLFSYRKFRAQEKEIENLRFEIEDLKKDRIKE